MSTYSGVPAARPRPAAPTPDARFTLLGRVVHHETVGSTLVLSTAAADGAATGGPRLAVTLLADDVVRVRLAPTGDFRLAGHGTDADETPFSYALDPARDERRPAIAVQQGDGELVVETPRVRVRVALDPCRLTIETPDGRLLSQDTAGHGWATEGGRTEVRCWKALAPEARFFGLGDKTFELDRRGRHLTFWNADTYAYAPEQDPIYKSIPFALTLAPSAPAGADGEPDGEPVWTGAGLFLDNSYRAEMDLGATDDAQWWFGAADGELRYTVFAPGPDGPDLKTPLRRYCDLTGHKPMPALWSLGYHQSRWNYHDEGYARWIAHEFRRRGLPLDCLHLDIGHMDGYRVFTWNPETFPDAPALHADLAALGVRTVVIVDPGVKVDPGYFAYREGKAGGLFCENPDGTDFTDTVWPGDVHWPDFSKPDARTWWGRTHARYLESGVTGFWNDMNEPAILGGRDFPDDVVFAYGDRAAAGGSGAPTDHREAHNVYGLLMARATYEGLRDVRPDERPFLLTRACFSGSQRYAAAWTGDNVSTWEHLLLSLRICQSLSASGLAFCGPDIGGFAGKADPELFARWMQAGVLYPFMRTHYSHEETSEQEPWSYGEETEAICRRYLALRYRLLPTLYSAFERCTRTAEPPMKALVLEHPGDPRTHRGADDTLYLGEHLVAAPVVQPGARERDVYLPDVPGGWTDFWTAAHRDGGQTHRVEAPLDTLPLVVRGGGVVALDAPRLSTQEPVGGTLTLVAAPGVGTSHFYFDDGLSYAHEDGDWLRLAVEQHHAGTFSVRRDGTRGLPYRAFEWRVPAAGRAGSATADGRALSALAPDDADADAEGVYTDGPWLCVRTRTDVASVEIR